MRSEQEILDIILSTARSDERIRAAILSGSRGNPNAPRDIFQDFDVVYVVTEVAPFANDRAWIHRFGELMIVQMPEAMQDPPPQNDGTFIYLMQFADGNRIDLAFFPLARLGALALDSLSVLLLDKDGLFQPLAPASDGDYLPRPPTAQAFADCCNEFWWVCTNAAKGLWREEITYAKQMADGFARDQLLKMLAWYVGAQTQFSRNPGKFGKYLVRYLEPDLWNMLERTYAGAGYDASWEALFTMCDLFRIAAVRIAAQFGFEYPYGDDRRVSAHLRHVRALPRDATDQYPG
jgi:aminoglycoside 6-adenylyltransferase